jgi:hypothetical protein
MAEYVYIISEPETGYLKIGVTANPESRLCQLQIGNPRKLELLYEIDVIDAFAVETAVHEKLAENRAVGEWFKLNPDEAIRLLKDEVIRDLTERQAYLSNKRKLQYAGLTSTVRQGVSI